MPQAQPPALPPARSGGPAPGAAGLTVTPLEPPAGAVTRDLARIRELRFLERFERNVARLDRLQHPVERRSYALRGCKIEREDPYPRLVELLKRHGLHDTQLLDALPHERAARMEIPARGLLWRRAPRMVVAAAALSPLEALARHGAALDPLGREAVAEAVARHSRPGAYLILGLLSTVGWEPALCAQVPRGELYSVVLVEQSAGGGWSLADSLPRELAALATVFDPEDLDERVGRVLAWLGTQPELRIPGGHLDLERVATRLGVSGTVLDRAVTQICKQDPTLGRASVGGREILKRDRFGAAR